MKRLLDRIFYIPKYDRPKKKDISRLLMPSVVGMLLCMICLAGTTWAWFTASIQSGANTLNAARFALLVDVKAEGGDALTVNETTGCFTLEANKTYTVTLKPDGTANKGYGVITIDGQTRHTAQIAKPNTFTFKIQTADTGATLSVVPAWGENGSADAVINDQDVIVLNSESGAAAISEDPTEAAPADGYVVQEGDTLPSIAARFGVSVDALANYNHLDPQVGLQVGQTLQIPPIDWEASTEETTQETEATEESTEAPTQETEPTEAPSEAPTDPPVETSATTQPDDGANQE